MIKTKFIAPEDFMASAPIGAIKSLGLTLSSENGPWLAGGAVRRFLKREKSISDFDFFFKNYDQCERMKQELLARGFRESKKTYRNVTWTDKLFTIQLIDFAFYESLEALFDSFDFYICQFATDFETVAHTASAVSDLQEERLEIHKVSYAVSTLRRIEKYRKQGFVISDHAIADFLRMVVDDPTTINQDSVSGE